MKKIIKNLTFGMLIVVLLTSCASSKDLVYLQETVPYEVQEQLLNYEPKLQPDDLVSIHVSGLDVLASASFNIYESSGYGAPKLLPYLVNKEGMIHFPVLGAVQVNGLTTLELTRHLEEKIKEYLVNPIVNIRLLNFKISVMGDVKVPGAYTIPNERITILEALALAGDLNIHGKRKDVLLIREVSGKIEVITLDLTNRTLFQSPYYYLAQNDVIYVAPNKAKINSSAIGSTAGIILSSISTLVSLIAIFTR